MKRFVTAAALALGSLPHAEANKGKVPESMSAIENKLYVKKATWKETAIATMENAHQFDADLHRGRFNRSKMRMSAKIAGPFTATEEDKLNIKDTGTSVSVMGKSYPWRTLEGLKSRDGNDLAKMAGLKKGDCAIISVTFKVVVQGGGAPIKVPYNLEYGKFVTKGALKDATLKKLESEVPFIFPRYREEVRPKRLSYVLTSRGNQKPRSVTIYSPVKVSDDGTCFLSIYPNLIPIENGLQAPLAYRGIQARLFQRMQNDFPDTKSLTEMKLEFTDAIWQDAPGATGNKYAQSWLTGRGKQFLKWHYDKSVETLLAKESDLSKKLSAKDAKIIKQYFASIKPLDHTNHEQSLERFYRAKYVELLIQGHKSLDDTIAAVKDQIETFGASYPTGEDNLQMLLDEKAKADEAFSAFTSGATSESLVESMGELLLNIEPICNTILLKNPLLDAPLLATKGDIKLSNNWLSNDQYGKEIVRFSSAHPDAEETTLHTAAASINSIDLDWDTEKLLVCDNKSIYEINADGSGKQKLIKKAATRLHDACRLPSGEIVYSDASVEQAVPCVAGRYVGNMHIMDDSGNNERRLTYDQDHNWHPTVLEDGRVMFMRWEYTQIGHFFSRILMTMNPDGTGQVSRYGSNSYWPNSIFWPRQIAGQPSKFLGIVSGHHGVAKQGHLYLFDSSKGTFEADGVIQKIGEKGKKTEAIVVDKLVNGIYPHYLAPYPLGTTAKESGKYFLATGKINAGDNWGLYLVDVYDNRTLIKKGSFANVRPVVKRKKPPVIPNRVDTSKETANVFISDINFGPGLKGIPRGTVKSIRVATPIYRYPGNGRTFSAGLNSSWDINKIIGTVPVEKDGSASFEIPANTPIYLQPLNAEGQALQVMRSWFVAMPGEAVSCIGCHEDKNAAPPVQKAALAARRAPSKLQPWFGKPRGLSFAHDVQPVLDRKCVGCHDGSKNTTLSGMDRPNFKDKTIIKKTSFGKSYTDLQQYVRRPGPEPDNHMANPTQWMADTSHLVKMLKKGHHNVQLDREEWERIYTWIDLNAQYAGRWTDSYKAPTETQIASRKKHLSRYSSIVDDNEVERALPEQVAFQKPERAPKSAVVSVDGWPFDAAAAKKKQAGSGLKAKEITLADSVTMDLIPIPAGSFVMGGEVFADEAKRKATIDKPFYMSSTEVTYEQFKLFDKEHDNEWIEKHGGNRVEYGLYDMNQPELPAIYVSQKKALAFCEWLSKKLASTGSPLAGMKVTLPTEEQWEWAARAGNATQNYLSEKEQAKGYNIADKKNMTWNFGRYQDNHDDGQPWTTDAKSFKPNAWGLYNMLGNVAEWTRSTYTPLDGIGTTDDVKGQINYVAVRGGSYNDTAAHASLSSRWRYMPEQPVNDVGFRVIVQP